MKIETAQLPANQALDLPAVQDWLGRRGVAVEGRLTAHQIQGGRSNLTFFLSDAAGSRWVLRRPPMGHFLATAHDVAREVKVLEALASAVPVPAVIGLHQDADGVPFYVMREVPGRVIRTAADAEVLTPSARATSGVELMTGLATLHGLDPDSVGLGAFGRGSGYLERQIALWQRQGDEYRTQEFAEADQVRERLLRSLPEQNQIVLVHGDYRLDNVLVNNAGELQAILDWELCTRGDPWVDLAVCLYYWTDPADLIHPFLDPPTVEAGFLDRGALLEAYTAASGRTPPNLDYYLGYAAWRLALVFEGVLGRFASGAYGESDVAEEQRLTETVKQLVAHASELLDGTGG